jgi:signal transduction histidine kinase
VLFLTARDTIHDKVKGLELGADDYLVKPFDFAELLARVRTILRRRGPARQADILRVADLQLDLPRRKAIRAGVRLDLTAKELALLELLVRRQGEPLSALRDFYEALAADRGIEVVCGGEATLEADLVLFRQAISNLVANALNYTPRGGTVSINVRRQNDRIAEVNVTDTGFGIPAEHLPRIFDRFYRVDPARSQQPNASGLGLAIVKSIMALHGGTVNVQSELGKGSTFSLRFPPAGVSTAASR